MNKFIYEIWHFSNAVLNRQEKSFFFICALFLLSYLMIEVHTKIIEYLNPFNAFFYLSIPVISYANAETYKSVILNDNKGKPGIYRWTHIYSGKIYIGSAIDIIKRLKNYFNLSFLERKVKTSNSMIYRAMIKYGYSNFTLDIIEYCDVSSLVQREQYYLDLFKPEYNIMKSAGSVKGFKHKKSSIELIRAANIGRIHSNIVRNKISENSATALRVMVKDILTGNT